MYQRLLEAFQDPRWADGCVTRHRVREGEVKLRRVAARAQARVLQAARHPHTFGGVGYLRIGVADLHRAVEHETEAEGKGDSALISVVPPVADKRLVAQGAVGLGFYLIPEGNAVELIGMAASLGVAFGESHRETPLRRLSAVECHGDAFSILLTREPGNQQSCHAAIPGARDHGTWCVDDDHHLLSHTGIALDQNPVSWEELQGGPVRALHGLGRRDHHKDNIGCFGQRIAPIQAMAVVRAT
mmetsp:Transcript_120730/g.257873  ORF Transcript_120730/g.257873 Transcript_120730/m.257873 type:complete len:243 (+) Transcript_120730:211-939(+)